MALFKRNKSDKKNKEPENSTPVIKEKSKFGWGKKTLVGLFATATAIGSVATFSDFPIMDAAGPYLAGEPFNLSFKVPAHTRAAVPFGGEINNGYGYVADEGWNWKIIKGYDEPVFYPVNQISILIDKNDAGEPITTETAKAQPVENVKLRVLFHFEAPGQDPNADMIPNALDNLIAQIHTKDGIETDANGKVTKIGYEETVSETVFGVHQEVFGNVIITNLKQNGDTDLKQTTNQKNPYQYNLMLHKKEINKLLETESNIALQSTKLKGLVVIDKVFLDFELTEQYTTAANAIADTEAQYVKEQASLKVKTKQAEQVVATAKGARKAAEEIAHGAAAGILEPGMAEATVLAAKIKAAGGAEEYREIQRVGKGWDGKTPVITGGDTAPIFDTRGLGNLAAAIDPSKATQKLPTPKGP